MNTYSFVVELALLDGELFDYRAVWLDVLNQLFRWCHRILQQLEWELGLMTTLIADAALVAIFWGEHVLRVMRGFLLLIWAAWDQKLKTILKICLKALVASQIENVRTNSPFLRLSLVFENDESLLHIHKIRFDPFFLGFAVVDVLQEVLRLLVKLILQLFRIRSILSFDLIFDLFYHFLKYFDLLCQKLWKLPTHSKVYLSRFVSRYIWNHFLKTIILVEFAVHIHHSSIFECCSIVSIPESVAHTILFENDPLWNKAKFSIYIVFWFPILYLLEYLFLHVYLLFEIVYFIGRWKILQVLVCGVDQSLLCEFDVVFIYFYELLLV